jgi:uncharacterized Actinobacterial protein TIGR03083
MAGSSPWPLIHEERRALLADVGDLTDAQWATPSLCPGWTVRDVFGHMTATSKMTPGRFVGHFASAGFRFHVMSATDVAAETSGPPSSTVAQFRSRLDAVTHPPGPVDAMLGEAVVHSEDIRRPLGIRRAYPPEAVTRAADFFKTSNLLIGTKSRVDGLTLRATDVDWTSGRGPEVTGPILSLLMAMTGRRAALDDLSGDGLATLAERL